MIPAPLISVIIPTHNRAKTLERAVTSVLNQTFRNFELIIVDDGSIDETRSILGSYVDLNNVRCIFQEHRGCAAARNAGIRASRGRYLAFQDSDDEWLPEKLAVAVAALDQTGPDVGVFYSDMLRVNNNDTFDPFLAPEITRGVLISEDTLDYQVLCIGIQSAVIKRESLEKVGLFDEALPRYIDLELFIRLSDHFVFLHHKHALVKYFDVEGISTNTRALVVARRHLLEKYYARLRLQKHHLSQQYLFLAAALKRNGNPFKACLFVLKALVTSPWHAQILRNILEISIGTIYEWCKHLALLLGVQLTRTGARLRFITSRYIGRR